MQLFLARAFACFGHRSGKRESKLNRSLPVSMFRYLSSIVGLIVPSLVHVILEWTKVRYYFFLEKKIRNFEVQ